LGGRLDTTPSSSIRRGSPIASYEKRLATFLRQKYRTTVSNLIVAIGDDATRFMTGQSRRSSPACRRCVLRCIAHDAASGQLHRGRVGDDLTGTVKLAAALDPALRHVYVVTGADPGRSPIRAAATASSPRFDRA
jgi:hypothetical protein